LLAEWDPFTMPIITEVEGTVSYADLLDNVSVRDQTDDATGITSKIVTDWRSQPKMAALRPRMALMDAKGKPQKLPSGLEAVYYMSVGAILTAPNGSGPSRPATSWHVSRAKRRKHATSPAVCRVLPNCSKRAARKKPRSSAKSKVTRRIRQGL
jgi:hypothetical protein